MKNLYFTLGLTILIGCATIPKPTESLNDVNFSVFPHIINRDGIYYLKYRIKISDSNNVNLLRVIHAKVINHKAFYYFSGKISFIEWGNTIEHPLEFDGFSEYARRDSIYWLNKDMSEQKLKIKIVND